MMFQEHWKKGKLRVLNVVIGLLQRLNLINIKRGSTMAKKGKLELGVVEGEMAKKVALFQAKILVLAQESDLSLGEVSVALDILKDFLEEQGIHSGIVKVEKNDSDSV